MTIKSGVMETAGHLDETGSGNDQDGTIMRETGKWGQEAEKGKLAWDPSNENKLSLDRQGRKCTPYH